MAKCLRGYLSAAAALKGHKPHLQKNTWNIYLNLLHVRHVTSAILAFDVTVCMHYGLLFTRLRVHARSYGCIYLHLCVCVCLCAYFCLFYSIIGSYCKVGSHLYFEYFIQQCVQARSVVNETKYVVAWSHKFGATLKACFRF